MTAPGVSAGLVYVDVEPRTTNFWPHFVAQTAPGAAAAGATLGGAIGAAMAARIQAAVNNALSGLNASASAHGAALGNSFGGKFAQTARVRIQAALRSLPEANIGVATTAAEQKLRDLRAQLETLSTRRIGVDISETDARAEVARLKQELDQLARVAASPRIRIDSGNASLELRRLEEELDRLDGRRANARVDVDEFGTVGALSRMNALISAGLALGPAIIPVAAAAAGAIAGIGVAALSAAPAVGVLALAFGGIGSAVKALGNAEREAAKTGNTVVQQQKSLASGADQVRSAVASLANTRAQAADQHRRALAQIEDAEKAVTRAQRDATEAQEDLNTAREEERRAQEDTAINLKKNAAEQGKIALEVADLQRQLAAFGGEHTANALAEALAEQEELAAAGKRLTADQERDKKTGIDGSRRVLEAQQRILDAQERVTEAVEREAEARLNLASQARQSAFQISQAERAVDAARRSAGASASAAASTAGAALDKLNEELSTLPRSGQVFARFLFGLKPQLDGLREAAADGLLPGAQAGITRLLPYVRNLRDFVSDVADELGDMAEQAGTALTSPFWRQFFGFIGDDAVPVMRGLGIVTGNVVEGIARMALAFVPFERQVGGGLINVTERFVAFAKGIGQNRQFQGFVAYALTEGPRVVALIGALVTTGVRLGQAYAPVGTVVLAVLRGIAAGLNAIPLPVLTGLVVGITAYKTAVLAAAIVQGTLNSGLLTGAARMITFGTATSAAGVTTTAATRALTAMQGAIGGPFVLALTAAAATIGYLVLQQQKSRQEADAAKQSLQDYASGFKDGVTPAALESSKAILANNAGLRGIVDETKRAGIATSTLVAGLNGDKAARDQVVASLDAQIAKSKEQSVLFAQLGPGQQQNAKAASDHAEKLQGLRDAFIASNDATAEAASLTGELAAEQQKANDVFDGATPRVKNLGDAYRILADETATAADKANALRDAEEALFGAARDADEAAEAQAKAIRNTNKLLDERGKITDKGSQSLDYNTEAGSRLRDSLKDQLSAINATFRANVANGKSIEEATKQHDAEVAALKKKVTQQGVNKDAVQKLIDIYGQVPTSANTSVTISGLDDTKLRLDELLAYQYALRNGVTLGEAKDKLFPQIKSPGGKGQSRSGNLAEGGPVYGPGTGTSDDVPAMERSSGAPFWLSNGEFVQPAASVDYYGQGLMEALRRRAIPRGAVRGFAAGGLIDQILSETYPFPTTTANTKIPTRAEVAAAVVGKGITGEWPSSPSAQRGDSGVWKSIVALIRSTGPLSGQFGNSYRPGDPLWHGSGRAVDWMGYNQDALASFLARQRPLELIHRTKQRDYAYTRGRDRGSFNGALMEAHRNHIHIAMAAGGLVNSLPFGVFDRGGTLAPGLNLAYNGLGRPEVLERADMPSGNPQFNVILSAADPQLQALVSLIDVRVERGTDAVARDLRNGVRN